MAFRCAVAVTLLLVVVGTAMASSPAEEAKALLDFKAAVKNPKSDMKLWGLLDSWTGTSPCYWSYVKCTSGHVTDISFYDLGTVDEDEDFTAFDVNIGPSFAKLDYLQYLAIPLKQNAFPLVLTSLLNLRHLHLTGLTGSIPPQIGQLRKLKELWLQQGSLRGSIPAEIRLLTSLESLGLAHNQLTASIPAEIGLLTSLKYLWLYTNQLASSIPAEIGLLTSLQGLDLSGNKLVGGIPPTIGKLTRLINLDTSFNQLDAPLPKELGNLSKLGWLSVDNNKIPGPIPAEIAKISTLEYIDVSNNMLSGPIPPQIALLKHLFHFKASDNLLTRLVPSKFASVLEVDLSNNYLSGAAVIDDNHKYDSNCLNITACTKTVPGQRPFAECLKVYPALGSPCRA